MFHYCFNPRWGASPPVPINLTQTAWGSQSIGTGSAWFLHQAKHLNLLCFSPSPLIHPFTHPTWESLGQKGDQTSQLQKEINPEYLLKDLTLKQKF